MTGKSTLHTQSLGNQDAFLLNKNNKLALIALLSDYLQQNGITVYQATGDADNLIVSVALNNVSLSDQTRSVAVVAEDTDILVLLLYHRQPCMNDIYFLSESKRGKGGRILPGKCISVSQLQNKIGPEAYSTILATYAFGGCDTTSSIFGIGKGSIFNKINSNKTLHQHCLTLQSHLATVDEISLTGVHFMAALYGAKNN